jgi:hypothetical protein
VSHVVKSRHKPLELTQFIALQVLQLLSCLQNTGHFWAAGSTGTADVDDINAAATARTVAKETCIV